MTSAAEYDPHLTLRFRFPHKWYSSLVTSILPSLLVFCVAVFAQWKTQKIQIFISAMAVISIIIMQTTHRGSSTLSLEDLWLCCTFLHVVCVLIVDLSIPTRRVRYNTIDDENYDERFLTARTNP
uniref:Transmembrane protein n=1 Tax=Syphacia muris TaxID=451379 RepID=A0A0N5AB95_9BILA